MDILSCSGVSGGLVCKGMERADLSCLPGELITGLTLMTHEVRGSPRRSLGVSDQGPAMVVPVVSVTVRAWGMGYSTAYLVRQEKHGCPMESDGVDSEDGGCETR